MQEYFPEGTSLPEFGGYKSKYHRGIIPTGETLLYLLGGSDPVSRKKYFSVFQDSRLLKEGHILIGEASEEEPFYAAPIYPDQEFADKLLMESIRPPKPSPNFPAELIRTELEWEDLILSEKTFSQIKALEDWLTYNKRLMEDWGLKRSVKPGYRVMFFGPPGTGKTLRMFIGLTCLLWCLNTLVKPKKISHGFFRRLQVKAGFCFLMRLMHFLEKGQMSKTQETNIPIKR